MELQIQNISALDGPETDLFRDLTETELLRLHEPQAGLFMAETLTVIERALDAGYEPEALLLEQKTAASPGGQALLTRLRDLSPGASDRRFPVFVAEEALLRTLTGYPLTRGALCAMRRKKPLPSAADLLKEAHTAAVLCEVMNPTNLGAILRSAAALGIDAVLLTAGCTDPLYRRAVRVSVGTVFQVPWTVLTVAPGPRPAVPREAVTILKEAGFLTAAMALAEDSLPISTPSLREAPRKALFLGSEGPGLPREAIDLCDLTVRIPMAKGVDSLNVAAASAVAFWELVRPSG